MHSDLTEHDQPGHDEKVELFARLLAASQRRLFLYILALVHNPADAEEILQETNIVLWRKFEQYQPNSDFFRWACQVAFLEVKKFRQRSTRLALPLENDVLEQLASSTQEVLEQADVRRHALQECLKILSPTAREMLRLRYQPNSSTETVANLMGKTVEATRRALHRIRMKLLECIQRKLAADAS